MTIIQKIIQFLYTIFTQPIRVGEITISVSPFLVKISMLRQSDVARMLGVSHQRVSQLRLRHRIEFTWNRNLKPGSQRSPKLNIL